MSEAATSLIVAEVEDQPVLRSWEDAADLVHISPNATAVNKRFTELLETPRDTVSSECDVE